MKNDIEPVVSFLDEKSVNISEIGKYGKFASFKQDHNDKFQFKNPPFMFYTNEMVCEKLDEADIFLSMERMESYLEKRIAHELKQDWKLQNKIKEINRKAKERIEKLESKPRKKLKEKYKYDQFENYFYPKPKSSAVSEPV